MYFLRTVLILPHTESTQVDKLFTWLTNSEIQKNEPSNARMLRAVYLTTEIAETVKINE